MTWIGNLPILTQNSGVTETRPINYGVNWILKL